TSSTPITCGVSCAAWRTSGAPRAAAVASARTFGGRASPRWASTTSDGTAPRSALDEFERNLADLTKLGERAASLARTDSPKVPFGPTSSARDEIEGVHTALVTSD